MESLPDPAYARPAGIDLGVGLLLATAALLVVLSKPLSESGKLTWLPAVPLAVSLPLFVAVVLVVTVWLCIRMARSPCPRCGRVIRVDFRRPPELPLEFYSDVCEHCRVRRLTNIKPDG